MDFIPVKCPSCGGDLMLPGSRLEAICSYCGSRFLLKNAASPAPSIDNWYSIAQDAVDVSNYEEAYEYAKKIIEVDPRQRKAWFIKGISCLYLLKGNIINVKEVIQAFTSVLKLSDSTVKENNTAAIAGAIAENLPISYKRSMDNVFIPQFQAGTRTGVSSYGKDNSAMSAAYKGMFEFTMTAIEVLDYVVSLDRRAIQKVSAYRHALLNDLSLYSNQTRLLGAVHIDNKGYYQKIIKVISKKKY